MAVETIPFTHDGYERLKLELAKLKAERPVIIAAIAEARGHGDLSENADYSAAREKQGFVEARIAELEDKLSRGQVVSYNGQSFDIVKFGAVVQLEDENSGEAHTYQIVGDLESDLSQKKISVQSPIAKALLGKKLDDSVRINVPKGVVDYVITAISYE